MNRWTRGLAVYMLVGMSVAGLALAQAQEMMDGGGTPREMNQLESEAAIASGNHVLKKTYFQTVNDAFLNLSTTWVNAFADTVVNCPSGGTCTIAVTVSSQFGDINPAEVARARVFVNGLLTPPGDDCCLNIARNAGLHPETNTMTFVARGVPAGNRLVQVQFSVSNGAEGYADYRTLEIGVYKP